MAKNLIPEIAKMLGVEIGEEFKIKGYDDSDTRTYKFTAQGLRVKLVEHPEATEFNALAALNSLLVGDAEIVKMPWKPNEGQTVYSFYSVGLDGVLKVVDFIWVNDIITFQALVKAGWVYKTRAEAEAALPAVAAEMGVEYELPTSGTEDVEPWKPKEGEFYYSFGIFAQTWGVSKICWLQHPFDFALLAKGWVYRTKEEAKAALPKVAAEMGVEYEL